MTPNAMDEKLTEGSFVTLPGVNPTKWRVLSPGDSASGTNVESSRGFEYDVEEGLVCPSTRVELPKSLQCCGCARGHLHLAWGGAALSCAVSLTNLSISNP